MRFGVAHGKGMDLSRIPDLDCLSLKAYVRVKNFGLTTVWELHKSFGLGDVQDRHAFVRGLGLRWLKLYRLGPWG